MAGVSEGHPKGRPPRRRPSCVAGRGSFRVRSRGLGSWAALAVVAAGGCGDVTYAELGPTPEVIVATGQGRLCAGMQPWVDAEIERVQAHTGLQLSHSLWVELGDAAVAAGCADDTEGRARLGCAVGAGAEVRVYARPEALAHELVHALRRQWELSTVPFLEEGWAEAVAGSDVHPSVFEVNPGDVDVELDALLEVDRAAVRDEATYAVAVHVVRFLEASVGVEAMAAWFRGGVDEDAEAARVRIEAAFGASWTTWVTRWSAEADVVSARGDACAGLEIVDVPVDGVEIEAVVDCGDPGTFGIAGDAVGAWTRRCMRVSEAGIWEVEVDAAVGSARIEAVAGTCAVGTSGTARVEREIDAGAGVIETELGACVYAVVFGVQEDVVTQMSVRVMGGE